jgi:plastocyanin
MNIATSLRAVPLLGLLAAMMFIAACGDDDDNGNGAAVAPTATPTSAAAPTPTAPAETGPTVTVGDDFFQPAELTVKAGETVRWVWSGGNPHSVKLNDTTSPTLTGSGNFEFTFDAPGRYEYVCGVHGASMAGVIVVE